MQQIRIGNTIATRRSNYHHWDTRDYSSINEAKRANGLNSRKAAILPPVKETRRLCDRRVVDVEVKTDHRIRDRRAGN